MTGEHLYVSIATVPWRRASCDRLLREMAAQTLRPDRVHLILDGYEGHPTPEWGVLDVPVMVHRSTALRGCGNRWRIVLAHVPPEALVATIDDDVQIPPDYLARMVAARAGRDVAVCCSGYIPTGQYVDCYRQDVAPDLPVADMEPGTSLVRVGLLRDLPAMPLADELLGPGGHDEGLLSAYLWQRQIPMRRVYVPGVTYDPTSKDPRALGGSGERLFAFRRRLREVVDWPAPT